MLQTILRYVRAEKRAAWSQQPARAAMLAAHARRVAALWRYTYNPY